MFHFSWSSNTAPSAGHWFGSGDSLLYSQFVSPRMKLPHGKKVGIKTIRTPMSLVIFCLLFSSVDYIPVKGEIIWYLSLTAWLISLSIMLSSSIHAVEKGISSFFISAA